MKGDGWLEELAEGPALKVGAEAPNWKAPPADADENPPNVSFSFAAPVPPASVAEKENGEGVTAAAPVDGADDPKAKTGALDLAAGSAGSAGLLATLSPADPRSSSSTFARFDEGSAAPDIPSRARALASPLVPLVSQLVKSSTLRQSRAGSQGVQR